MKTLLQCEGIVKRYGARTVLDGATVALGDRMKVGVLGRNGAGKSTLVRILSGEEEPDDGTIVRARDLRLAHLEQHDAWEPGEPVIDYLVRRTGRETWECARTAARFGIKHDRLEGPVDALSGGWRTRVKIATMLAAEPNYLLLDEPTNFLDLSTLLLLQDFLADFAGGALIVSHDREFLKRTCDHTLEVAAGQTTLFSGDLEDYLEWKEQREEHARRHNATVEAKRKQLQTFIDRFGAKNTKATQAKSKAREMERLRTIDIGHRAGTARISIPSAEPRKGTAFDLKELTIGYPDHRVARDIHLTIARGRKVAIVGDNGQGKTTLLRTLAGDLDPLGGNVRRGHGIEVAYYAQHVYESLVQSDTVHDHLRRHASFDTPDQAVLDMAGHFLFHGDEVQKPVTVLSGGERARLCLAGLLLTRRPVLLLDEPTNHLDFQTVEALGSALAEFDGTVLFISHDRTFVHMVADDLLEVDGGRVRRRAGSYDDYVVDLERRVRAARDDGPAPSRSAGGARDRSAPTGREAYEARKRRRADAAKARQAATDTEKRVAVLQSELESLHAAIEADPTNPDAERYRKLHDTQRALAEAEEAWLAALAAVEELAEEDAAADSA